MPQVKITIDDKIYKQLKKAAKENFRTVTNEINYRLQQSFIPTPAPTPIPAPLLNPNPGIPVEPYKITLTAQTEGGDTATVPVTTTTPAPIKTSTPKEKTKQELHPEWFNSQGRRIVVDDEPEPEWDADRGHTRP